MSGIGAKIVDMLSGGIGGKIVDGINKFIPDKDLAKQLAQELDMTKLLGGIDLQKIEIEAEKEMQIEIEKTHQAALNQEDLYTKRTRPKIARQSWGTGIGYAIITVGAALVDPFVDADLSTLKFEPMIFGTLVGPAVWYMGMRGFDKWKGNG